MPAAHPIAIFDKNGWLLARGRTVNISEHGVFAVASIWGGKMPAGEVRIELKLPSAKDQPGRPDATRTVEYQCKIIRTETVGDMLGMGIEFLEKLS